MSKKEEVKQGEVKQPQEGVDFKKYEYADVFFECSNCGHMTTLDKGITDGLSFVLPATDKHEWRMVCNNCQNMMRIFFRASSKETIEAAKAKEAMEVKTKEAAKKEENNELSKENKEAKPTKGNTRRTKRTAKTD